MYSNRNPRQGRPAQTNITVSKLVMILADRYTGAPLSTTLKDTEYPMFPSERVSIALVAQGLGDPAPGARSSGAEFVTKAAFYAIEEGQLVLRYPPRLDKLATQNVMDRATANWLRGFIYNTTVKDGAYYLKADNINAFAAVTPHSEMPGKVELAMDRANPEDCHQLIQDFLELEVENLEAYQGVGRPASFTAPTINRYYSPDRVDVMRAGTGFVLSSLPAQLFRIMAIARFTNGVRVANGQLLHSYSSYLNQVDIYREEGKDPEFIDTYTTTAERRLNELIQENLGRITEQLRQQKKNEVEMKRTLKSAQTALQSGIDAFLTYARHRELNGTVNVAIPEGAFDPRLHAIGGRCPMFTGVMGVPAQVVSDPNFNGHFTERLEQVLQKLVS